MKTQEHTAGPWQLCAHLDNPAIDEGCHCQASIGGSVWAANGEQIICEMGERVDPKFGPSVPPFERAVVKANARLIAAAPQLLEALEFIKSCKSPGLGICDTCHAVAENAIRSAKGETL